MKNRLLLGSKSTAWQQLLKDAQIPFVLVEQDADEARCDWGLPLQQVVEAIAQYKMEHVLLPGGTEGERCFVLTADTLSQDSTGAISGKPLDRDDARAKLIAARQGMRTATAFCLDRRLFHNGIWQIEQRIERFVQANYQFVVPDEWLETYLEKSFGLSSAGAIAIEGFGGLFLESIDGSHSTVVGLPLPELRQSLAEIGFF